MTDQEIAQHFGKPLNQFASVLEVCGIQVARPGAIVTREFRTDRSRYFPKVIDGIVTGGSFG